METAKVDIRKLQVLNDRINQCIEALNQVRLSVHGLSHTTPAVPFFQPGGVNPLAPAPVSLGYAGLGPIPFAPAYVPGLAHTTPAVPFFQPGGINPLAPAPVGLGYPGLGPIPFAPAYVPGLAHTTPMVGPGPGAFIPGITPFAGLSHSSPEEAFARSTWADPLL